MSVRRNILLHETNKTPAANFIVDIINFMVIYVDALSECENI